MVKAAKYVSRKPDSDGVIHYPDEEHNIWQQLILRQLTCIQGKACSEYHAGLERLNLPLNHIPQLDQINKVLESTTGWSVAAVPALISFDNFFKLLANKQFPVATFIRTREDIDYLQEPDIFHEIFGHCPLLTNQSFADFTHTYGKLGVKANKIQKQFLARLYWFTVEFGLIQTKKGTRIYGGGILSSIGETEYALNSSKPERKVFNIMDVLRTPYRIDIMQPVYFIIESIDELFKLSQLDLLKLADQAHQLGLHPALYNTVTAS